MESIFVRLLEAFSGNPASFRHDASLQSDLQKLLDYYENGQWLADYALDEQGLLPDSLRRGVLSEDGVYDFLADLKSENLLP